MNSQTLLVTWHGCSLILYFHLEITTVIWTKRKYKQCLRHGLLIGFLKRVGPVNNDVTAPDACPATPNTMLCHRGWLVAVVFQKRKAAILLLRVIWRTVDDNVKQAIWKKKITTCSWANLGGGFRVQPPKWTAIKPKNTPKINRNPLKSPNCFYGYAPVHITCLFILHKISIRYVSISIFTFISYRSCLAVTCQLYDRRVRQIKYTLHLRKDCKKRFCQNFVKYPRILITKVVKGSVMTFVRWGRKYIYTYT